MKTAILHVTSLLSWGIAAVVAALLLDGTAFGVAEGLLTTGLLAHAAFIIIRRRASVSRPHGRP